MSWTEITNHPDLPLWVFITGLALAVLTAFLIWRKIHFFKRSHIVPAKVASFHKRSALESNLWQVIVEYTDHQETTHQLDYTGSGPYPPFAKKDNLKVYFDPENPKKGFAYDFWKVWGPTIGIGCMALLMIWFGGVSAFYTS